MSANYFFATILCLCLLSCESDEPPKDKCVTSYLYSVGTVEAHYNSDHLISEYIIGSDTLARFEYNDDKQIKRRKGLVRDVHYYYDDAKKLKYFLEYINGVFQDSITFEYNQQDLISTITYYAYNALDFNLSPIKKIAYEYTNGNSSEARFYEIDYNNFPDLKLSSTFLYEYDNKKLPFPKETWPFYAIFDNGSIAGNNVIKQVLKREGQPESTTSYSYKYNSSGYPIQQKINNVVVDEYSYSCEPRLRGE